MADTELKKSVVAAQVSENEARPVEKKDPSKLLSAFGGFNAVRGFMPDADNLNPAKKAAKAVFLSDKRFKDKRENLINDIKGWLEIFVLSTSATFSSARFKKLCTCANQRFPGAKIRPFACPDLAGEIEKRIFEKDDFEKNVTYSRWCTGDRPIPKEILSFYDNAGFDGIQNNIQDDIIPNLINVPATRELLLELVTDSVDVISIEKTMNLQG